MTSTLHTLLAHAERQRDTALAAVQRAEQQALAQRRQAEQLAQYRLEYVQRGPSHNGRSTPIDTLRGHQAFMERLHQALGQQLAQVSQADAALARQRSLLLALEVRVASVQKLMLRRQHEAQTLNDRREQNRSDEAASQQLWRAAVAAAEAAEDANDTVHGSHRLPKLGPHLGRVHSLSHTPAHTPSTY